MKEYMTNAEKSLKYAKERESPILGLLEAMKDIRWWNVEKCVKNA